MEGNALFGDVAHPGHAGQVVAVVGQVARRHVAGGTLVEGVVPPFGGVKPPVAELRARGRAGHEDRPLPLVGDHQLLAGAHLDAFGFRRHPGGERLHLLRRDQPQVLRQHVERQVPFVIQHHIPGGAHLVVDQAGDPVGGLVVEAVCRGAVEVRLPAGIGERHADLGELPLRGDIGNRLLDESFHRLDAPRMGVSVLPDAVPDPVVGGFVIPDGGRGNRDNGIRPKLAHDLPVEGGHIVGVDALVDHASLLAGQLRFPQGREPPQGTGGDTG